MAFIENSGTLEQVYQTLPTGTDLSYTNLSLNPALPDANQLVLIWQLSTVQDSNGASISLASQSDAFVRAAQEIQTSLYSVEVDDKNIDASLVGGSTFDVAGSTYTRPALIATNVAAQPIIIRRSTNVTSPVVSYQPGARLTSDMLNTSEAQTLNAIQELTAFAAPVSGSSGGGAVDPSEINITQLDGVDLTSTGIANWDSTTGILSSTGAGNLVPQSGNNTNTPGTFLKQDGVNDGDIKFDPILQSDVDGLSVTLFGLAQEQAALGVDVGAVEGKIQNIGTVVLDDITNFSGDIAVTGDVLIAGNSVNEAITREPYWINMNLGDTLNDITGTGSRNAGNIGDFPAQNIKGTGNSDLNTTTGEWIAPRDMVINVKMAGHIKTNDGPPVSGSQIIRGLISCTVNGLGTLTQSLLYRRITPDYNQPIVFGELEGVIEVQAGDAVTLKFTRSGSSTANVGLENGSAIIREVR